MGFKDGMKGNRLLCMSSQKTAMGLKEMKSNEEPATGVGALYIGLQQVRNLRWSACAACANHISRVSETTAMR